MDVPTAIQAAEAESDEDEEAELQSSAADGNIPDVSSTASEETAMTEETPNFSSKRAEAPTEGKE
jgi:hypothetical protein